MHMHISIYIVDISLADNDIADILGFPQNESTFKNRTKVCNTFRQKSKTVRRKYKNKITGQLFIIYTL